MIPGFTTLSGSALSDAGLRRLASEYGGARPSGVIAPVGGQMLRPARQRSATPTKP
jgi:hypothetical protein